MMQVLEYPRADAVARNRNLKRIARAHRPHAFRRAGQDDITRMQGKILTHMCNQWQNFVDHIGGVALLANLTVDHQLQLGILRVA
ncbi:Hypothetical Protein PANA_2126 [Pantoea ananatis LMG 20103]|uniref:Uncharacterized protein n=1 Tax=Pantoea ananatis (strain LMG 20103) TaxID=706191 RepID=D4GG42_PANAM|nr:Hypothetical Protein PANA_2126 [Pantoea ananatis LMG 20103]